MEQQLWRETQKNLTTTTNTLSLQLLSRLQTLITNPSTSPSTITTILETLINSPSLPPNHHIFSLLHSLSLHHPSFSSPLSSSLPSITTSLLSDPTSSAITAAASLSLLVSLSAAYSLDDSLVISLCFRPCVSVRVWVLNNVMKLSVPPNLLLPVMLGFTKDPYPCVRKSALEGLVGVCDSGVVVEDYGIVEGCYFRAVELLLDQHDYVRLAALRAVSAWGCMLAASKEEEEDRRGCSDGVFLLICSMVRDMNVGVRVEAFTTLGKITYVSEDILLQTLNKKVDEAIKVKQSLALSSSNSHEIHAGVAAGAFIHGLEDEYSEVQRAACISLRMLCVISGRFAPDAVSILSYVLNDDSVIARLEALKTIHCMAMSGCVAMKEAHIDMVLGTLVDRNSQIRSRAFDLLGSVKLPDLKVSKLTVESLFRSLDIYPKSEAEIFRTLFNMGHNHGKFAVRIVKDHYNKIKPSNDEKSGCYGSRIAGLLVLAISASLKHEEHFHQIPPRIFSYAAAYFGRIAYALGDILDIDSLLAYLSCCGEHQFEVQSETRTRPEVLPAAKGQQEAPVHVFSAMQIVLATVKRLWPLVKCGCTNEVLKSLRCCKESLAAVRAGSFAYAAAVAFAFQYIHIVKLVTRVWRHFEVSKTCHLYQLGDFDLLLGKLDKAILAIRYRFIGLSKDVELIIMELLLLNYLLQLSSSHMHCKTLQKLSTMVASVCHLRDAKSIACSDFVNLLAELLSNGSFSLDATGDQCQLKKLRDLFILKDVILTEEIRHISAELVVLGFDSVSPLRFISGLPVGIPLDITLYNVTNEHKLWLKIVLDDKVSEFVFLDMEEYGGLDEVKKFKFTAPFYRTPKTVAYTLRVSMGMECMSEDLHLVRGHGGPKHALTYISLEIEAYFVNLNADHLLLR
ncbi:LOW QUALITY PROTEIN: protein SIEL-like [Chenopodium quinoa]|uniref:LOW QUALITY PROTEIN: protein SIEL-like n=1 Tax=Chenopodium quinoa TaxID=63459 RepID=UPI000B788E84|nr:LOW QUALITY PROTEIN: protein SIEL-like [Chenopodium quinoa]